MKHKNDIYNKPKRLLSEYLSIALVSLFAILFFSFEIYSYLNEGKFPKLIQEPQVCHHEEKAESNISLAQNQTPKLLQPDIQKEERNTTEPLKAKEELQVQTVVVSNESNSSTTGMVNPLSEITILSDEAKSWAKIEALTEVTAAEQDELLRHAIEHNHESNMEKMIARGYKFLKPYYDDANQLVFQRKYTITFLLLKHDLIDVNAANKYGYTLLHEATSKGHTTLIRTIIKKGADINAQANDGASVLHYPARLGYGITVQTLIDMGVKLDLRATLKYPGLYWNQSTPLHIASKRGHIKIVKKLVDAGADWKLEDGDGLTARDLAAKFNHMDIVSYYDALAEKEDAQESVQNEEADATEDENTTAADETNEDEDMAEDANQTDSVL